MAFARALSYMSESATTGDSNVLAAISPSPTDGLNESSGPSRQRASAACRRCRRYRQKCVMTWRGGVPCTPCESCLKAGSTISAECKILPRGKSGADRNFRRKTNVRRSSSPNPVNNVAETADRDGARSALLPCHEELVDGVEVFTQNYMQLGFLSRSSFLEQVRKDPGSMPVFLLLSILALSARFTTSLVARFGSPREASAEMRRRALSLLPEEMLEPTVERMQALFLLGVNDFGEGDGGRSWLLTGIAIRMAATLRLHREATYHLGPEATPEQIVAAEVARRSFWLVYCHDQQVAGRAPSTTFPSPSVDVLLPAEEDDFVFGVQPASRAALPSSKPTLQPGYSSTPPSLFGTMIIGQWYWARTAEHASNTVDLQTSRPWDPNSETQRLDRELVAWEAGLPRRHVFSAFTLKGMKGHSLDLGFASIGILLRLSHIVLRRAFMSHMLQSLSRTDQHTSFWQGMARQMVDNSVALYELLNQMLSTRKIGDGFPAVFIFALHICGDIGHSLARWPVLHPMSAHRGGDMLHFALATLQKLEHIWPLATRWRVTLSQLSGNTSLSRSSDDGRFEDVNADANYAAALGQTPSEGSSPLACRRLSTAVDPHAIFPSPSYDAAAEASDSEAQLQIQPDPASLDPLFAEQDPFGADLTAFLRGEGTDWRGWDVLGSAAYQPNATPFSLDDLFSETSFGQQ